MTEDYKKEQSILHKWFHLRAATQFANSSGISGSGAACCTPSTLTSSSTCTSFRVIVILEGIKLAHYSCVTKHPSASAELCELLEKLGRMVWDRVPGRIMLRGTCGWLIPTRQRRAGMRWAPIHITDIFKMFFSPSCSQLVPDCPMPRAVL